VYGAVNLTHPARPEEGDYFIASEAIAGRQAHGYSDYCRSIMTVLRRGFKQKY
jgi:hypothetical protein